MNWEHLENYKHTYQCARARNQEDPLGGMRALAGSELHIVVCLAAVWLAGGWLAASQLESFHVAVCLAAGWLQAGQLTCIPDYRRDGHKAALGCVPLLGLLIWMCLLMKDSPINIDISSNSDTPSSKDILY